MTKKINLKLKKIALATSSALMVLVMPTVLNAAATPYAQTPLIWQSGTSTIRPNILLFLDTSGSMVREMVLQHACKSQKIQLRV